MYARHVRWIGTMALFGMLGGCSGDSGGTTTPPATGTVAGTVTSNGTGVSGAQVALSGGGSTSTAANGSFSFTGVSTGAHTLTLTVPADFELSGSETAAKTVTVTAGQTATVNWALQPQAPTTATVDTVRLSGTSFSPANLTVKTGSTIVWVNTESMTHTVTPDGHTQWTRAESSAPGEVTRATITTAGTFAYFCEPHRSAGMTGQIVVEP